MVSAIKTKNKKEAIAKAKEIVPIAKATATEVISAHVKYARNLEKKKTELPLSMAWERYSISTDRARPATVSEERAYQATFNQFMKFIKKEYLLVSDITVVDTDKFADYLRGLGIAVHTHNRKLRHLKKIFEVLTDYYDGENPFKSKKLARMPREERGQGIKRLSFEDEHIKETKRVLDDEIFVVINKAEIKVVYYPGMYTGQRMKDCVLLRWNKVNFKNRLIYGW